MCADMHGNIFVLLLHTQQYYAWDNAAHTPVLWLVILLYFPTSHNSIMHGVMWHIMLCMLTFLYFPITSPKSNHQFVHVY